MRHRLFGGNVTADAFHTSLAEEHNVVVKVDSLSDTSDRDAGMSRGIDFAVFRVNGRCMIKHRSIGIGRLTEHPQRIIACYHAGNVCAVHTFPVVVKVSNIAGIVQAAMPKHVRIVLVSAEEHSVIEHLEQCAAKNSVPILRYGLLKLDRYVVLAFRLGRVRRCVPEGNSAVSVVNIVSAGIYHHVIHLHDRNKVIVNVRNVQEIAEAHTVRKECILAPIGDHVHVFILRATAHRLSCNGCGRHIAFHRFDSCAVKLEIVLTILEVPYILIHKGIAGRLVGAGEEDSLLPTSCHLV